MLVIMQCDSWNWKGSCVGYILHSTLRTPFALCCWYKAHRNLWLLTYFSSLRQMLGEGDLLSPRGDSWESGFRKALGMAAVFLQVFDLTDGPCLNFLVICHFISCQVFNFCLLEVTLLWTSPHSNWICHRNRTLENFIFFFPAWRQASRQGIHIFLQGCSSFLPWLHFPSLPPCIH